MSRIDQFYKKISSLRYAADQENEFIKSREKEDPVPHPLLIPNPKSDITTSPYTSFALQPYLNNIFSGFKSP
jgi:hypothetical protein